MSKRTAETDREPKRLKNSEKAGTSKDSQIETHQAEKSEQTFDCKKPSNSGKTKRSEKVEKSQIENSERLERPKPLTSYKKSDSSKVAIVDPYVAKEPEVITQYPWFYENRSYRNYVRIVSQISQSNLDSDDD